MRYTFLLKSQCLLLKSYPYRDDEYIRFDMFNRRMKDAPTLLMGIWYGIIFTFQNVSMYRQVMLIQRKVEMASLNSLDILIFTRSRQSC